jgi:hypothetical protein
MNAQERLFINLHSVRIGQKMSILNMIEGVTSERSLRRYQNLELLVPVSVVIRFAERMHIPVLDLYSDNRSVPAFQISCVLFLKSMWFHNNDLLEKEYSKIKKMKVKEPFYKLFKKTLDLKYAFIKNQINSKEFEDSLHIITQQISNDDTRNPFVTVILIMTYLSMTSPDPLLEKNIISRLYKDNYNMMLNELYLIFYYRFLKKVILYNPIPIEDLIRLLDMVNPLKVIVNEHYLDCEETLQRIYISVMKDQMDMAIELSKKLVALKLVLFNDSLKDDINWLKKVTNIDLLDII